ncbi:MAG: transcription-repair coupling factor, partial [Planctomycetaceae bacterium]
MTGFDEVVRALDDGQRASIDGAWGSSCALLAAALTEAAPRPLVVVVPAIRDVDDFAADLDSLLAETPLVFPAWETLPEEHDVSDAVFGGRLRVLSQLDQAAIPRVIVTSLPALLQPIPARSNRRAGTRRLTVGGELQPDHFLHWLVARGFERTSAVEVPGEFAVHGGIIDVFPP